MIRGNGRGPWWTLVVGGICGAIVATVVLVLTTGGDDGSVRSASAQRPASSAPATSTSVPEVPSVTFIGDSWTEGIGATGLRGYADRTGEQLGWHYTVLGVGASGYDLPGRGSTFGQRVDRAIETDPDVIVVQGSLNERNSTLESLRPAAVATLQRLRSEADPETRIVVLGASYNPGTPDATIDWINDAVRDAAALAGVPFIDVAAEGWTDPVNTGIWADPLHPNDVGYQMVADHLVPVLRAQLGA